MNALRKLAVEGTAAIVVIVALLSAPIAHAAPDAPSAPTASSHQPGEVDWAKVRVVAGATAVVVAVALAAGMLAPTLPIIGMSGLALTANGAHVLGLTALTLNVGGLFLFMSGGPPAKSANAVPGHNGSRDTQTRAGSETPNATKPSSVSGATGAGMLRD